MSIVIVQLSDIHLSGLKANPVLNQKQALTHAISSVLGPTDEVLILATGDIANTGSSDDYLVARSFFSDIARSLQAKVLFVPGNHDVDLGNPSPHRERILEPSSPPPTAEEVPLCTAPQAAFQAFCNVFSAPSCSTGLDIYSWPTAEGKVAVLLYNSAICSTLKEKQQLKHPKNLPLPKTDDYAVVVWAMHHTMSWFSEDSRKRLLQDIAATSDFIASGHEHMEDRYTHKSHMSPSSVTYWESGVLQDRDGSLPSTFAVHFVSPASKETKSITFKWRHSTSPAYELTSKADDWREWRWNDARFTGPRLSDDFRRILEDPGAAFTHRHATDIRLQDLFVEPQVQEVSLRKQKRKKTTVRDLLERSKLIVFMGESKSGKSALARYMTREMASQGLFPVLIDLVKSKLQTERFFLRFIRTSIEAMYGYGSADPILQKDKVQRWIFVDNIHTIPSSEHRDAFLRYLEAHFDYVIVFSEMDLRFPGTPSQVILQYEHAELCSLGNERRSELVQRWFMLGQSNLTDAQMGEQRRRQKEAEDAITLVMGKSLISPFPIYVLVILQTLDSKEKLETSHSSQGHLFEVLVTQALAKVTRSPHELSARHTYLSKFAWDFFGPTNDGNHVGPTLHEAERWHVNYCDETLESHSFADFSRGFHDAGIWSTQDGRIIFHYPYFEAYYLAKWLAGRRDEESKPHLEKYVRELHTERSSSILLFLAHQTASSRQLVELLLATANNYYHDLPLWYGSLPDFITTMGTEIALSIDDGVDSRAEDLRELDNAQEHQPGNSIEEDEFETIIKLNGAFRTIQILGQVLRSNYAGMPKEEKLAVAKACCDLSLRTVASLELFTEGVQSDSVLERLTDHITRNQATGMRRGVKSRAPAKSESEHKNKAKQALFFLYARMVTATIHHAAQSTGIETLNKVYEKLVSAASSMPHHTAYRLIEAAIQLEHYSRPDFNKIEALYAEQESNVLLATSIRFLTLQHLRTFPIPYATKQSLCNKFHIELTVSGDANDKPASILGNARNLGEKRRL